MTFEQIDKVADQVFTFYAVALFATAVVLQKGESWKFILRTALAVVVCQQISKRVQKLDLFHHAVSAVQASHGIKSQFPSSHFTVVLCIATAFYLLNKRFLWVSLVVPILYGAVMLYQHYHTPLEMLGAFYAVPLTWLCVTLGTKRNMTRNATVSDDVVTN